MSSIGSPIDEINNLRFEVLPSNKPVKARTVIRHERTIVVIGENGKLYTNAIKEHAHYQFGHWPWIHGILRSLQRAKVISSKAVGHHLALVDQSHKQRNLRYEGGGEHASFKVGIWNAGKNGRGGKCSERKARR